MPKQFDKYRMIDGVSPLAARYFNPIFRDVDLRVAALEDVRIAWETVVRTVTDFGLARINETIGPSLIDVNQSAVQAADKLAEIDAARLAAIAAIATFEDSASAAIDAWKTDHIADLADMAASRPLHASADASGAVTLAAGTALGQLVSIRDFGVYEYDPAATEVADGETMIEPIGGVGRWLLIAPSWDFVWSYLAGVLDDLQAQVPDKPVTVNCTFGSVAAYGGVATLNVAMPGASVGDCVAVNFPSSMNAGLVVGGVVSSPNVVTLRLTNTSNGGITPASMNVVIAVIKQ